MQPLAQTRQVAMAVVLVSALLALTLCTPASAQLAPPDRNAVMLRIASFGNPVYEGGFSWGIASSQFDIVAAYSATWNAPTGNLFDAGVRYHFPMPTGVDAYVGAGWASVSTPFFGFANGSGITGGAGGSVRLSDLLTGYGSVNIVNIGSTSGSIVDVGVELRLSHRVSGQLGYMNFTGVGGPYVGVSFGLH